MTQRERGRKTERECALKRTLIVCGRRAAVGGRWRRRHAKPKRNHKLKLMTLARRSWKLKAETRDPEKAERRRPCASKTKKTEHSVARMQPSKGQKKNAKTKKKKQKTSSNSGSWSRRHMLRPLCGSVWFTVNGLSFAAPIGNESYYCSRFHCDIHTHTHALAHIHLEMKMFVNLEQGSWGRW